MCGCRRSFNRIEVRLFKLADLSNQYVTTTIGRPHFSMHSVGEWNELLSRCLCIIGDCLQKQTSQYWSDMNVFT